MSSDEGAWTPPFATPQEGSWQPPFSGDSFQAETLFLFNELDATTFSQVAPVQELASDLNLSDLNDSGEEAAMPAPTGEPVDLLDTVASSAAKVLNLSDEVTVREDLLNIASTLASGEKEEVANQVASVLGQISRLEGYDESEHGELLSLASGVIEELAQSNTKLTPGMIALAIMKQKDLGDVKALADIKPSAIIEQGKKLSRLISDT